MTACGPREATPADAAELTALHNAAADSIAARLGPGIWGKHRTVNRMRERLAEASLFGSNRHFLVWENSEIVSTVMVRTHMTHFWRRHVWRDPRAVTVCVFDLAVLPAFQRRGLGTMAMRYAEQVARMIDATYVRLDAFSADPQSNAFYQALGYECRGAIKVTGVELNLYEKQVAPFP